MTFVNINILSEATEVFITRAVCNFIDRDERINYTFENYPEDINLPELYMDLHSKILGKNHESIEKLIQVVVDSAINELIKNCHLHPLD